MARGNRVPTGTIWRRAAGGNRARGNRALGGIIWPDPMTLGRRKAR